MHRSAMGGVVAASLCLDLAGLSVEPKAVGAQAVEGELVAVAVQVSGETDLLLAVVVATLEVAHRHSNCNGTAARPNQSAQCLGSHTKCCCGKLHHGCHSAAQCPWEQGSWSQLLTGADAQQQAKAAVASLPWLD